MPSFYSPATFISRYHAVFIGDQRLGLATVVDIQNYWNGWSNGRNSEYWDLLRELAKKLKLNSGAAIVALPQPFYIKGFPDQVDPAEDWHVQGLRRVYEGRASPDEMADAARLAEFCGRPKFFKMSLERYCTTFFGLDCNTFVGNYLGISPSSSISSYAMGYGKFPTIQGATGDVYATRTRLPLAPIIDPARIETGNVVCTFGEPDKKNSRWRHIAIVENIQRIQGNKYFLWLAEWGAAGNIEEHRTAPAKPSTVTITAGAWAAPEMGAKNLLAFSGGTPDGKPAKRIFFNHHSLDDLTHRGWHVGGIYGV